MVSEIGKASTRMKIQYKIMGHRPYDGAGLMAGVAGCRSTPDAPGSSSHASVIIKDRSDVQIRSAARSVFGEHGYTLANTGPDSMVFQQAASQRDSIKWGGWYSPGLVIRAKLKLTPLAGQSCLVQLDMFVVQNAGQGIQENEDRMVLIRPRPYQELLDEMRKRALADTARPADPTLK